MLINILTSPFVIALLTCVVAVLYLKPIADKYGLFDMPNGRKLHDAPVLVMGGIAMTLSFVAVVMLVSHPERHDYQLLLAMLLICIVGVYDDYSPVSARVHFVAQVIAISMIVFGHQGTVQTLGDLIGLGELSTVWLAVPFTAVCILGVINAINMIDGVDGLAGCVMLTSVFWFGVVASFSQQLHLLTLLFVFAGVLVGFLFFNLRLPGRARASIFMGNAGSMTLGLLLCWFAIQLCGQKDSAVVPMLGVWIIAFPLMDMFSVMLRRIKKGLSPFVGDRTHMHHLLQDMGFSVSKIVLIETASAFLLGAAGFLAWFFEVSEVLMFISFLCLLFAYTWLTSRMRKRIVRLDTKKHSSVLSQEVFTS